MYLKKIKCQFTGKIPKYINATVYNRQLFYSMWEVSRDSNTGRSEPSSILPFFLQVVSFND